MTFDATVGGASANSYATVAEATAYLGVRGNTSTWTALSTTEKENKLQWACLVLDTLIWKGEKTTTTQALDWPRAWMADKDGVDISSSTLPSDLKNAHAEMAFQLIANDWTQGLGPTVPMRVKVGSIEIENQVPKQIPSFVTAMLRQYLSVVPGQGSLVRG